MKDCGPMDALSDILDNVPELVFVFTEDGRYLFINRAAAEFLGSNPLDVIGFTWRELGYPAEVMEPLSEKVQLTVETGETQSLRLRTSPARGSRMLDLSLTPLEWKSGGTYAVLVIAHDISEFF